MNISIANYQPLNYSKNWVINITMINEKPKPNNSKKAYTAIAMGQGESYIETE